MKFGTGLEFSFWLLLGVKGLKGHIIRFRQVRSKLTDSKLLTCHSILWVKGWVVAVSLDVDSFTTY